MPSILQKVRTLFSANLHGMIDRALETNSLKVMDEYIRQVERNLDALEDSAATVGGSVRTLKRKYEEFSNQSDKLDRDIDTLILRGKNDLAAAAQAEMNTKQELAQEYYEQWQAQQEQYQGMLNMRMKLEGPPQHHQAGTRENALLAGIGGNQEGHDQDPAQHGQAGYLRRPGN